MAYSLDTQQMKQTASRNNGRNYSTAAAIFFYKSAEAAIRR